MKKNYFILFRIISCCILLNGLIIEAYGQKLTTANGAINIKPLSKVTQTAKNSSAVEAAFEFYAVAVFNHIPNKQLLQELQDAKIQTLSWIEKASYVVKITSKETYNILKEKSSQSGFSYLGIRLIGAVPSSLKLSKDLYRIATNPLSPNAYEVKNITISVYNKNYVNTLTAYLFGKGIAVLESGTSKEASNAISVGGVTYNQINDIAALNYVSDIKEYTDTYKEPGFRNLLYAQIYPVNYDTAHGYIGRNNYSGNVETISSTDPEILRRFRNRLVSSTITGTGTMTSHAQATTSVMASGTNFDELDGGIAPATKLIQGYWDAAQTIVNYDAGYHPLSVNTSVFGFPSGQSLSSVYTSVVSNWDDAIQSHPDLLFSASAGNNGHESGSHGYPIGWNNLIYGSGGKNSFTVGNTKAPGNTTFGSSGPTNDGRLAPQISTEGESGTSFASPNIAGQISNLFEAYTDVYHTTPKSDVVKAILMNTAQDIYKKGPDFRSGYGESNPSEALKAIKEHTFLTGTVEQGESTTPIVQTFDVSSGLRQLRVMLYWHDYKGTPNAAKILVNDLDLKVVTPAGDTVLPWVLSIDSAHVADTATRGIDTLNNQEQVTINDPQAGTYKFLVYGKEVAMGPQDYVLTYMLNPYHIKISTPDGYRLPPVNYFNPSSFFGFTWDYALNTDNTADSIQVFLQRQVGDPFVQIGSVGTRTSDGGATGEGVTPEESARVGFYLNYPIPTDFPITKTARIIVKQKNQPYADTSGYYQYSPMVDSLKVIASCPEKVILRWKNMDSLHSGGKYIVYRLSQTLMEPEDSVPYNQDSITLTAEHILGTGQTFSNDEWFAVAARYPNGILSYRTYPVTQRLTNALLEGTPGTASLPQTSFTLCKADTVDLKVDLNYLKDSVRWYKDGVSITDGTTDSIRLTMDDFGKYTYESYYQGCAFTSDTFFVYKSTNDITLSDTVYTSTQAWRCYVYRGDYSNNNVYGYFDMNNTDLNLHTMDYYNNSSGTPWSLSNYIGCPLVSKDYTLIMKRNGFPTGSYAIIARKGLNVERLWIDGQLVYTSPTNLNSNVTVWSGELTADSKVRVELRSVGKSEGAIDFITETADMNLALGKPAVQSSTSTANGVSQVASNATDGDYTDFSSTTGTNGVVNFPYMNIDLGDSARIDKFLLWNRTSPDVAVNRLHNYYIFSSNDAFEETNTDPSVIAARTGVYSVYRTDTAGRPTIIGAGFKGRYIRIQMNSTDILNLSELEAFGQWLNPDSSLIKNLALKKPAKQSSTYKTYYASNAVDGIIDGAFVDGSVTNTGNAAADMVNPWWMVDLGKICHIKKINVYNRTDASFAPQLHDYNILVSSDSLLMSTDTTVYPSATVFHDDNVAGRPTTFNVDVVGRYIALQLPGTNVTGQPAKMIDLAELQAFGYEADTSSNILPVELGAFTAVAENDDALLNWSTLMENNNKSFDVERLDNDNQFKKIGAVSANNIPSNYQFKDVSPKNGANTYRLKQYDLDGKFTYSPIRIVIFDKASNLNDFVIQPNPVGDILKIVNAEAINVPLVFRIIDMRGGGISSWRVENPGTLIEQNISTLSAGTYFLQIETNTGIRRSLKFIKN